MKKKTVAGLITIVVIALCVTVTMESGGATQPTQAARGDAANWLHFGYASSYTAYNPLESTINITNVAQLERIWGIGCDDPYYSDISRSPAIYNGTLFTRFYTAPARSKLHAYDARTGQMLWEFSKNNTGWAPQPVVSEDGIIFDMEGSNPTHLYAVDADTGEELWEAPLAFEMSFKDKALVTIDQENNVIYLVEVGRLRGEGKLFALNKQTGEIVWYKSKATDDVTFEGDYVLLSAGKIFVDAEVPIQEPYLLYQDRMLSINASSHEIEIIFDKPEGIELDDISKYTLCNDKLIVTFCDRDDSAESIGTLVVYDVTSQAVLWQKEYSTAITGRIACNTTKNVIYVPTDPYLYALNAASGEEVWKYMGYGAIYNPSIANGIVYFISDTNMCAIDENTGEKLFFYPLGHEGGATTQVAICDGMLYFSGSGGTCDLYALGLPEDDYDQVSTPTFSPQPQPETYNTSQNVTISCTTTGATIYYTTNGDDPTSSSTPYLDFITVNSTTTIKAVAVKEDFEDSEVAAGTYIIKDFIFTANWLHFGYDDQYSSYNPLESTITTDNISQLERKWGIGCDEGLFSVIYRSPAIYKGKLYTSGAGSRLTAYDAQTGQMLWQFGNGNLAWAPQPVVSEDGVVFYLEETIPTYLYAVDANSGNMLWQAPIGFELGFREAAEALVTVDEENNIVFVVEVGQLSGGGKLFALDKQTGEILWYKSDAKDYLAIEGNYL